MISIVEPQKFSRTRESTELGVLKQSSFLLQSNDLSTNSDEGLLIDLAPDLVPKLVLIPSSSQEDLTRMDPRTASPQSSTTDSALGGSTSPEDESSQRPSSHHHMADSSFSDEREENFESYGENGDVEYEA